MRGSFLLALVLPLFLAAPTPFDAKHKHDGNNSRNQRIFDYSQINMGDLAVDTATGDNIQIGHTLDMNVVQTNDVNSVKEKYDSHGNAPETALSQDGENQVDIDVETPSLESVSPPTKSAAIDGKYLPWSDYGSCSVKYGLCGKTRTRTCTDPQNAGRTCEEQRLGPDTETIGCNEEDCLPVNENEALFEDDMILDDEQIAWLRTGLRYGELDGVVVDENTVTSENNPEIAENAVKDPNRLWPDNIVYYSIDGTLTPEEETKLRSTLSGLQKSLSSCITFEEKNEGNRIIVGTSKPGCWSEVGYKGTTQNLNLASGCWSTGTIEHEFLHAIGIYHTQSRYDRDLYIRINWNNIQAGMEHNFNMYDRKTINDHGLPYDFKSVMHYPGWAFQTSPSLLTIETLDPTKQESLGNRAGVTKGDVELVRRAYGCTSDCSCNGVIDENKEGECLSTWNGEAWCYVDPDSRCSDTKLWQGEYGLQTTYSYLACTHKVSFPDPKKYYNIENTRYSGTRIHGNLGRGPGCTTGWHGAEDQMWRFERKGSSYYIYNKHNYNHRLVSASWAKNDFGLYDGQYDGEDQKWRLTFVGGNKVRIYNVANGYKLGQWKGGESGECGTGNWAQADDQIWELKEV